MHPASNPRMGLFLSAPLALLLGIATAAWADRFPPDAVQELKEALQAPIDELVAQDPAAAKQLANKPVDDPDRPRLLADVRRRAIARRVDALQTLSQMHRAFVLQEWSEEQSTGGTPSALGRDEFYAADLENKIQLAKRLQGEVRKTLRQGGPIAQLATIRMIGDLAASAIKYGARRNLVQAFAADLVGVMKSADSPAVREAAARTLGAVFADPRVAVPALSDLLRTGNDREREAAAAGLLELVQGSARAPADVAGTRPDLERASIVAVGRLVVPAVARGVTDRDPEVRRLSAEAIEQATMAMLNQVPKLRSTEDPTSMLSPSRQEAIGDVRRDLPPLVNAVRDLTALLGQASSDPDVRVRIAARRALEAMGETRRLLSLLPAAVTPPRPAPLDQAPPPPPNNGDGAAQPPAKAAPNPEAALAEALRSAMPALIAGLSDPDVRGRLAALDALETYGPVAAEAAPALVRTLRDPAIHVRRAAVRALGRIGPADVQETVPALGQLLAPAQDLDVRMAAAVALDRYGPPARDAVPALIRTTRASDAILRVQAIHTLEALGTDAAPAVPALISSLKDPDGPVREAAAHALGRFGKLAESAQPALRLALDDSSPQVRQAASDALLSIIPLEK
jgi:HEAT repeat protein